MKSIPEMFQDIIDLVTRKTKFTAFYPYVVTDETNGRPSLKALTTTNGLPSEIFPDQLHIDKAHGLPGASSDLAKDTIVLLGFVGGDPGSPFVAFYLPKQPLPVNLVMNASGTIKIGESAGTINLAGGGHAVGRVGDICGYLVVDATKGLWYAPSLMAPYAPVPSNNNTPNPPTNPNADGGVPIVISTGSPKVNSG